MLVLPPKRFEDDQDPKFDSIRYLDWFGRLAKRREKLPLLKQAYSAWTCCPPDSSQDSIADAWGVDARELRDYADFVQGESRAGQKFKGSERAAVQMVLDRAYAHYCALGGSRSIQWHIDLEAPYWGMNPREIKELWEVDPCFWPTNYRRIP